MATDNQAKKFPFGENWQNLEFNGKAPSQPQYPTTFTTMSNGQKKYNPMIYNTMNDKVFKFKFGVDICDAQYIKQTKDAVKNLGVDELTEKFDSELRKVQSEIKTSETIIKEAVDALGLTDAQTGQINATQSSITKAQINDALAKLPFLEGKIELKSELQKLDRTQIKSLVKELIDSLDVPICIPCPDFRYHTYEANYARSGIRVNLLFSQAAQGGADLGYIDYVPGAFVALHEHPNYEMVVVLRGDYIENGVTYYAGQMVLRGPNSYHSTASRTGCTILASRFSPVIQRPDLFNEFHQLRDNGEIDAEGKRVGNPLDTTETEKTIKLD